MCYFGNKILKYVLNTSKILKLLVKIFNYLTLPVKSLLPLTSIH